jgi:DNA-binding CsgD family transcriptional regulator
MVANDVTVPLLTFRRRDAPPLVATLLPADVAPSEPHDVAAIMHMVDPVFDTDKMLSPLCRLYGLSRVETSLVCRLTSGDALNDAAKALRIREQTARSYLKQIFIKTGTKRQAQLIVLMLSSVMRIKRDLLQEAMTQTHHRNGTAQFA